MKIAVPIFGKVISPRFDGAQVMVLLTVENGEVVAKEKWRTQNLPPLSLIRKLSGAEVDVLICGNIDSVSEEAVEAMGIKLIPWVTGEAEDAVACFLKGELAPGSIVGAQGVCGRWGVGMGRWGCRKGRWYQEIIEGKEQIMPRGQNNQGKCGRGRWKEAGGNENANIGGRGKGGGRKGKGCRGGKQAGRFDKNEK